MPGDQERSDRLAEREAGRREAAGPDRPGNADRPERGSLADLRRRLEHLPPGHPSSPYNDDFTRKPPALRLKFLELPLHGGERGADPAATSGNAAAPGAAAAPATPAVRAGSAAPAGPVPAGPVPAGPVPAGLAARASASAPTGPAARSAGTANGAKAHQAIPANGEIPANGAAGRADGAVPGPVPGAVSHNGEGSPNGAADRVGQGLRLPANGLAGNPDRAPERDGTPGPDTRTLVLDGRPGHDNGSDRRTTPGRDSGPADNSETSHDSEPGRNGMPSQASAPGHDTAPGRDSTPSRDSETSHDSEPGHDTTPSRGPIPSAGPRSSPEGSWESGGRYLNADQCRIAEAALNRCRRAEGRNMFGTYGHSGLTAAMRRVEAMLRHGQLLPDTEARALKPPDQFKARLADLIARHPDKPAETLSHEVHDGVRYAFIFDAEGYTEATLHVHSRLKGQGFELEARRNGWNTPEYKGINTRWRDPAHDLAFEVQFHTKSSWDARERAQALYRKVTDTAIPVPERERLRSLRAEMSAAIPVPPGSTAIPDFRKEQ
jgi:hypothetical protein